MREINAIVLHHSASREADHTWEDIRKWHLAHGWNDIGYHWGVVYDGGAWRIVRGRPVEREGAHAKGFNRGSIGICFEGNFETGRMGREQYGLGVTLVRRLVLDYNVPLARVKGHRELPYATVCPGRNFPIREMIDAVRGRLERK